jgi:hypothetical protein
MWALQGIMYIGHQGIGLGSRQIASEVISTVKCGQNSGYFSETYIYNSMFVNAVQTVDLEHRLCQIR